MFSCVQLDLFITIAHSQDGILAYIAPHRSYFGVGCIADWHQDCFLIWIVAWWWGLVHGATRRIFGTGEGNLGLETTVGALWDETGWVDMEQDDEQSTDLMGFCPSWHGILCLLSILAIWDHITAVQIDDFLFIALSKEENNLFKEDMWKIWTISDLGDVSFCVRIAIKWDCLQNTVYLSQTTLIDHIVAQFGQRDSHPTTSIDPGLKLQCPDKTSISPSDKIEWWKV